MIAKLLTLALGAFLATAAPQTTPANPPSPPEWTQPIAPFQIVGNIYYVGTKGLASYLIATPKGLILLDATMEANVPTIEANIKTLGFKLSDVKILINNHAHFDHAGGLAMMKRDTGAKVYAMAGDVWALENGKHDSDQNYTGTFTPVKVDHVLKDGEKITLGGVTLTAIATPGHTKGCTTYLLPMAGGHVAVFPGSLTVAGSKLVGNTRYPNIVADFRASFDRMATIKGDLILPPHPELGGVLTRQGADRFAPGLLPKIVADARAAFEAEWRRQSAIAK
jgi:metallo-beta-lactamase class B